MSGEARASGAIAYRAIGLAGDALAPWLAPRFEHRDGSGWATRPYVSPGDPGWLIGELARDAARLVPELTVGEMGHVRGAAYELVELRNKAAHFHLDDGPRLAMRTVDRVRVLLETLDILPPALAAELASLEDEASALHTRSSVRSLEELRSSYLEKLLDACRHLDLRSILPVPRPSTGAPDSVYVPPDLASSMENRQPTRRPRFARDRDLAEGLWPEEAADLRIESYLDAAEGVDRAPWQESLASRRCVVLGGPGSGKTSLLLHITREVALGEDVSERATLPILVRARDLGPALEAGTNLRDHLLQRHAPEYAELLRRVLDTGPFLLLIDSIDEAGTEETRRAISNMVADFARQHEQGRVIASSRPAGYESWGLPAAFSRHYLLPFDGPHIRDYVSAWLGSQRAPADVSNIDGVLAEMRAASVLPLAQTPLLLALLMLVRGADGRLTGRRTVLYNHAVDALAERWPRRRGADISPEDLLAALRPLAVAAASRSGPIPEQDLIAALVAVRVERGASRSDARRWAQRLLRTVEDETGVVAQVDMVDGEGRWVFFHRSIADHLAARDLADRWLDGESPFERLLGDAAGREILGFALGHLDDDGPEIGARALLEILNGRDQLEAFTGRRARFVVELLTDTGIRATPGVRAAALARVRAIAVDPRSPWRVQAASLLARYQAGSGEDPWSDLWVPEGAGAVAHAVASWACGPLEPDRVAAVQESMAAGFVDEDIERTASVVAEVLTSLGGVSHSVSLQVVILGRAYARVDRAIGEALRAGGVPSLDGKHLLTAVASRSVPPIWMCDLGLDLDLADLLLVLEAGLPADFAAEITSWWDRSEWIEPTEEQLDLLAQLAVQHPEGFLLLYEEMDRRDDDDDGFDASPWDPALVALASASEGALARRALATFVGAVGVDVILGSHLELRDSVIHAAADACHPSEWEVERDRLVATYRDLNLDTRAPIDGVRVAALRALIDHDDPAIRGSAARALLGICDSRREEALVAFVRDRACGPSLLEDLSAHARGDPWVVRSLFLRLLALCEAVDVAEWQGVAQQVLLHAIDAAAELAGDDLDRSFEMKSPLSREQPQPGKQVIGHLLAGVRCEPSHRTAVCADVLALMPRSEALTAELAGLLDAGGYCSRAAIRALRPVDLEHPGPILDAVVQALGVLDGATLQRLGKAIRESANRDTRHQAAELLGMALGDRPWDPPLLAFARGLLGRHFA